MNVLLQDSVMPILRDVQFGLRVWKNRPGFTAVAVLTLALGIAVNTTVFGWIDAVLLHPLPGVGNPGELALLETVGSDGAALVNNSYIDYRDYRDYLRLVTLAIGRFTPLSVGADGKTERAWAELVSANYFDVLQVKPVLGRTFLPGEVGDKPGAFPLAVISYQMWRNRFHGDPKVVGKTIRLNRNELTIIGVAPPQFHGSLVGVVFDVWMPITMAKEMGAGGGTLRFRGTRDITSTIARLKPGVTLGQARAEVAALAKRLTEAHPDTNRGVDATLLPVWAGHLGTQNILLRPLGILAAVSVLLLLIVCANVANLLLARAVARHREFAIRLALGAHPGRVMRQLMTEALLLAGAGSFVGVILVMWMAQTLEFLLPIHDVHLDLGGGVSLPSLAFMVLISVVATVLSGTAPALLSARANLNDALKEGGRGNASGTTTHRLRGILVTAEVALAMVALAGAGLFYRSFQNATGIHPGFDVTNVSVSQFYLSNAGYSAKEQWQFCRTLRETLEATPGVTSVSYTDVVPLSQLAGSTPWHRVEIEGYVPAREEHMIVHRATVAPGYFGFMRIPFRQGRDFTERDEAGQPSVMIVNETFARRYFRGANPVGRKVNLEGDPVTVVGMVKDSKYHTTTEAPIPYFYVPFRQRFAPGLNFSVLLRTEGDPLRMTPMLRRQALALNQDAAFTTMLYSEAATTSLYPQKVAASLLSVVGIICVLMAAIGLFSVMSYAVSQRTQELGIRMALGARPAGVRWLVVHEGLRLTLPGLAVGAAISAVAVQPLGGMLVKVGASDPATLAVAAGVVGLVSLAASYLPALRATRLDPMQALRRE